MPPPPPPNPIPGSYACGEPFFPTQIFPDEEQASANLKILEMARKWKKQKADGQS
jgi:hypothetical protein